MDLSNGTALVRLSFRRPHHHSNLRNTIVVLRLQVGIMAGEVHSRNVSGSFYWHEAPFFGEGCSSTREMLQPESRCMMEV